MKIRYLLFTMFLIICFNLEAQNFSKEIFSRKANELKVTNYWGSVHVLAGKQGTVEISGIYTDANKRSHQLSQSEFDKFITTTEKGDLIIVSAREPTGFESIDLTIYADPSMYVNIDLLLGGDIKVSGILNGVQINSRNGSVDLNSISGYAIVNATNGAITAQFNQLDPLKASSFITLNGEIRMIVPANLSRDIRFKSTKKGYVRSDFAIKTSEPVYLKDFEITNDSYSKTPISINSKINSGGELLYASTGNGPILILKNK